MKSQDKAVVVVLAVFAAVLVAANTGSGSSISHNNSICSGGSEKLLMFKHNISREYTTIYDKQPCWVTNHNPTTPVLISQLGRMK